MVFVSWVISEGIGLVWFDLFVCLRQGLNYETLSHKKTDNDGNNLSISVKLLT